MLARRTRTFKYYCIRHQSFKNTAANLVVVESHRCPPCEAPNLLQQPPQLSILPYLSTLKFADPPKTALTVSFTGHLHASNAPSPRRRSSTYHPAQIHSINPLSHPLRLILTSLRLETLTSAPHRSSPTAGVSGTLSPAAPSWAKSSCPPVS